LNPNQPGKIPLGGFLSQLSPAALKEFQALAIPTTYPSGSVLFMEGQAPRGVFLLLEGEIKLSLGSSGGKTLILRLARPGEVLGLMSTLSGSPYELTGEAMYPCQVAYVRGEDFLRFIAKYPEANQMVVRSLSAHYRAACEQLRTLGLAGSAHEKLAKLLLDWCAKEKETRDGTRVRLPLTHEEIAELIGTSRETVTRTLSEFRSRRLVTRHGATFIIPNRQALASFAAA
jgi:CRP/FNR family transcriptional regulator